MDAGDDNDNTELEAVGLGCSLEKFSELEEVMSLIDEVGSRTEEGAHEKEYERFRYVVNLYKEQPHLVHPHLSEMLTRLMRYVKDEKYADATAGLKHEAFRLMYLVTNVVGYKVVVRELPHSVADLVPVLDMLERQDPGDTATWQTRYCLLLWLSIVVKIPFHLSRLDYSEETVQPAPPTIAQRIIRLCERYLVVRDSCRYAAAVLCAHFFTRSDVRDAYLKSFLDWGCEIVAARSPGVDSIGVLAAIASILKLAKREDVLCYAGDLLGRIQATDWKKEPFRLNRKLTVKVIQRIGLTFLKPTVLSWRYRRGCRSIAEVGGLSVNKEEAEEEVEEEESEVAEEVEEVVEELTEALKDGDLSVRWTGAKGVGRVAGRLTRQLADEVVASVLELLRPGQTENAWHGGCLALAELSKRGLLLPSRLARVMPLLTAALSYDEPRGFASVGAVVRDAACYLAWTLARAYDTTVLAPHVHSLATSLVVVACFDREINIRRAAAAAFQEHIGRQGSFPHGIEILTSADYFSLAVRQNAYLNVSVFIAQFPEYSTCLVDHLVHRKIEHWDAAVRELSSKALHNLTCRSPNYLCNIILPCLIEKTSSIDVNARHGAILSIGEIVHALFLLDTEVTEESRLAILGLVRTLRERHQFRGMNGELMKSACCHLIFKCCLSKLKVEDDSGVVEQWQELVDECLCHEAVSLSGKASLALSALAEEHYRQDIELSKTLVHKYTGLLDSSQQSVRTGSALALGSLPFAVLRSSLDRVVTGLVCCARATPETEKWVESRKEAVKALTTIAQASSSEQGSYDEYLMETVKCFVGGLQDYTTDDRGDTGAWVREASMAGLLAVLDTAEPSGVTPSLVEEAMSLIAEQAVHRIDRTRFLATSVFVSLLYSPLPHVPHRSELFQIFPDSKVCSDAWSTSYEMLDRFVSLMPLQSYSRRLLRGYIISVGGLTESLVKHSSKALFSWLTSQDYTEQSRVCNLIIDIFENSVGDDRIIQPMTNFLELILSDGCLTPILKSSESRFAREILRLAKLSLGNSTIKYKVLGSIHIYCQLVQVEGGVGRTALGRLMVLLCHRLGWVRRSTACSLYEALLVYGDALGPEVEIDQALSFLSDTDWALTSVALLRPVRDAIALSLSLKPPVPLASSN